MPELAPSIIQGAKRIAGIAPETEFTAELIESLPRDVKLRVMDYITNAAGMRDVELLIDLGLQRRAQALVTDRPSNADVPFVDSIPVQDALLAMRSEEGHKLIDNRDGSAITLDTIMELADNQLVHEWYGREAKAIQNGGTSETPVINITPTGVRPAKLSESETSTNVGTHKDNTAFLNGANPNWFSHIFQERPELYMPARALSELAGLFDAIGLSVIGRGEAGALDEFHTELVPRRFPRGVPELNTSSGALAAGFMRQLTAIPTEERLDISNNGELQFDTLREFVATNKDKLRAAASSVYPFIEESDGEEFSEANQNSAIDSLFDSGSLGKAFVNSLGEEVANAARIRRTLKQALGFVGGDEDRSEPQPSAVSDTAVSDILDFVSKVKPQEGVELPVFVRLGLNISLIGSAKKIATGEDLFDISDTELEELSGTEEILAEIVSFLSPLDLATVIGGGGAGGVVARKAIQKLIEKKFLKEGAETLGKKLAERGATGTGALGTLEAVREAARQQAEGESVDFGEIFERGAKGGALGALLGITGGLTASFGRIVQFGAEVGAGGTAAPLLEGRAPTFDDYKNFAGVVLGLKAAFGVAKIAGRGREIERAEREQIARDLQTKVETEGKSLQEAVDEVFGESIKLSPEDQVSFDAATNRLFGELQRIEKGIRDEAVQVREAEGPVVKEVLELSRRLNEKVAEISPPERRAEAESQLQELRRSIFETGEITEETLRDLSEVELADASSRLQRALEGDLDVPEAPPKAGKEIAPGKVTADVSQKTIPEESPETVETQGELIDVRSEGGIFDGRGEQVLPIEQRGTGLGPLFPGEGLEGQLSRGLRGAQAQREAANDPASAAADIGTTPSIFVQRQPRDIGLSAKVRTPSNLFGAIPGQPARYGDAAAAAMRDLVLSERTMMIETGQRGEILSDAIAKVDKRDWGDKGSKFYDHVTDSARDGELQPSSREAVQTIREFMERDRQEIIKRRRNDIRKSVAKIVEREFRTEKGLKGVNLTTPERASELAELKERVDAEVKNRIPDDYGIENYLPEMHPGRWEILVDLGEGNRDWVGAAKTPAEAQAKVLAHFADNPQFTPESYLIRGRAFSGTAAIPVGQKRLFIVANKIAKAAEESVSVENVRKALRGTLTAKETRRKFAGFLQEREGFEGFSKDITTVLDVYNQSFVRWKNVSDLNRRIQPMLNKIRAEGRPLAANELENIFDHLWGPRRSKPGETPSVGELLDETIQSIPGVRDKVGPFIFERSLGRLKGGVTFMFLKINPRFNLLNRLQRFQTTAPELEGAPLLGEWREGTQFYRSPEGKAALELHGIRFLTGGKLLEGSRRTILDPRFREKLGGFAPETSNQEIAWTTMFKRAKSMGMKDLAANDYAFLKGNLHTQFVHLRVDTPSLLRGPIGSTIFQFKRFAIKDFELGYDLISDKNFTGFGKWLGAKLMLGGANITVKGLTFGGAAYLSLKTYNAIKADHGEDVADFFAWGLPSLVGLDMSYSFQNVDIPYGKTVPEKIGNVALGPAGSIAISAIQAAQDTKGSDPSAFRRVLKRIAERVPGLKFLDALQAMGDRAADGDYNFRDAAGRLQFKADLSEVIVKAMGGRTIKQANIDLITEAALQVNDGRDLAIDAFIAKFLDKVKSIDLENLEDLPPGTFDWSDPLDWNELYPEFLIGATDLTRRLRRRIVGLEDDKLARTLRGLPNIISSNPIFQIEETLEQKTMREAQETP